MTSGQRLIFNRISVSLVACECDHFRLITISVLIMHKQSIKEVAVAVGQVLKGHYLVSLAWMSTQPLLGTRPVRKAWLGQREALD